MRRLRDRLPAARRVDLAVLGGLLVLAGILRGSRMGLLDLFEDGYHHWWIGGAWVTTGAYVDPMSRMTEGNWLPGYYPIVGLAYLGAGWNAVAALRALSLASSLATLVLVFALARRQGLPAAGFAGFFDAVVVQANLIGSMAIPESLVVLSVFGAAILLFDGGAPRGLHRLAVAAALLLFASTLRYEAWVAVAVLPAHAWWTRRMRMRDALLVAGPSLAFAAAWAVALLPLGGPLGIVLGQTAREAQNQIALGTMPSAPWDRFVWFWFTNHALGLLPMYLLESGFMLVRQRSEYGTWASAALFLGVTALVLGGLGTGSYRYAGIADPFVAVAAGLAVSSLVRRLRRLHVPKPAAAIGSRSSSSSRP
ncbi:MAG: hypothetical protein ACT4OI_03470 [Methanobacteriota archaeon]